jgi:MFS family permease
VIVIALFLIGIVGLGIARFSFGVLFESLQDEFGWGRAATSGIFSTYMLLCPAFAILAGWALDKYGPRKVFTAAGFFTGLGLLLTSQVTASWHLFLTYSLLLAMGTGCIYVASMATVSKWFVERRGLALGIVSCGAGIGMMAMPPIIASLISRYGWHTSCGIMALVAFIVMIPSALLLKSPPAKAVTLSNAKGLENGARELSLAQAAKSRNFWLPISILFLFSTCIFSINTHIVPHALDLGISSVQAALMLSGIGGGSILGRVAVGRVSDSIGGKKTFLICALLLMGAMLWLMKSSNLWMIYAFTVVFGFAFGGTAPANAVLIGENFGVAHIGLIMAVINVGWDTGAAFGPILAGYIFDISGSYVSAFRAGAIFAVLATILVLFLRTPRSYNAVK